MANKKLVELPPLGTVTDQALFYTELNGQAYQVLASKIKAYLQGAGGVTPADLAALKAEILGGVGPAYDTLLELYTYINSTDAANDAIAAGILTSLGNKVSKTGDETVAGIKTFTSRIIYNTLRKINATTGKYVNFNTENFNPDANYSISFQIDEETGVLGLVFTNVTTLLDYTYSFPFTSGIVTIQGDGVETALASAPVITLDMGQFQENYGSVYLTHNPTFNIVNPGQNKQYILHVATDATTRPITLPANSKYIGPLTLDAGSFYDIAVRARSVGGVWTYLWIINKYT